MADATSQRGIERVAKDGRTPKRDALVVEAPLELRIAGESAIVLMRTPGHDEDLARGLLWSEGVVASARELDGMVRPEPRTPEERGNVIELGLDPKTHAMPDRSLYSSSSCGVCGKTSIAALELRAQPVRGSFEMDADVVAALPDALRAGQELFASTGGLHAAGAFDGGGEAMCIREDVGRHNAVDKLVGWALREGHTPMSEAALCVSGRLSYEIVQKAIVAGFPVIAAVSAPSSLAVDLAERFRVTLCGFVRDGSFNIYSHGSRIG